MVAGMETMAAIQTTCMQPACGTSIGAIPIVTEEKDGTFSIGVYDAHSGVGRTINVSKEEADIFLKRRNELNKKQIRNTLFGTVICAVGGFLASHLSKKSELAAGTSIDIFAGFCTGCIGALLGGCFSKPPNATAAKELIKRNQKQNN